jgi:exodeoxyribonuclease VIII
MKLEQLNERLAELKPGETISIENVPNDVYHASEGVSTSKLKLWLECPAKYYAQHVAGEIKRKEKKAFDVGSAAHCLILEPEKFNSDFIIQPEEIKVRRGKAWDAFKEQAGDKIVLTKSDWEACHAMRDAVMAHTVGAQLVQNGKPEVAFFKRDEETNLIIKCKADYIIGDLIVDVKTAVSSEPSEFGRKAKTLGYHIQDAIYRDVIGMREFAFLVIEKEEPHIVTAPILFDTEARKLGYIEYRNAMRGIKQCFDTNAWHGYTDEPVIIGLTNWEKQKLEQLELDGEQQ